MAASRGGTRGRGVTRDGAGGASGGRPATAGRSPWSPDRWVACVADADAHVLLPLREWQALEVARDPGGSPARTWVRGAAPDARLLAALRRVPGLRRFTIDERDRMVAAGASVPCAVLPPLRWRSIREAFPVDAPPRIPAAPSTTEGLSACAASPGASAGGSLAVDDPDPASAFSGAALRTVRSPVELESGAVVTRVDALAAWSARAPQVRLDPLRFAVDATGRAVVIGRPVPPVPGVRLVERDGILVPAGFAVDPPLPASSLREALGLLPGEAALLPAGGELEGRVDVIPADSFAPLRRSAVRAARDRGPSVGWPADGDGEPR